MKNIFQKLLLCLGVLILTGCQVTKPLAPTITSTATPYLTSTPYLPINSGTQLPPFYEQINSETAGNVILLAKWKILNQRSTTMAFSLDNKAIAIGSNTTRQVIRTNDGGNISESTGNSLFFEPYISRLGSYSPDGQFSIQANKDGYLYINRKDLSSALVNNDINANKALFFPDGNSLIIYLNNGKVWIISESSWKQKLLSLESGVSSYAYYLFPDLIFDTGKKKPVTNIFMTTDGLLMALIFEDKTIQLWRMSDLALLSTIDNPERPINLAFSFDGNLLAVSSGDNQIRLWDVNSGEFIASLKGDQEPITALAFSPNGRMLASLTSNWVNIWGILPKEDFANSVKTLTVIESLTPTSTRTPVQLPQPTYTPTSSLPSYNSIIPLPWPLPAPSNQQITEAESCIIDSIAESRYPPSMSYWDLQSAYVNKTACDWASLAYAYISHTIYQETMPEEGKRAFIQAILQNPAFLYKSQLFYCFFGSEILVEAPPQARNPIEAVTIDYEWGGIGEPSQIKYHIEIAGANLSANDIKVNIAGEPSGLIQQSIKTIDPKLIQAIDSNLNNFVPGGKSLLKLENCTDNEPNWHVKLRFTNGNEIILDTDYSNMLTNGGPWQTKIDGQYFLQYSPALLTSFEEIFKSLNLPLGQPYAMYCDGIDVFSLQYSTP